MPPFSCRRSHGCCGNHLLFYLLCRHCRQWPATARPTVDGSARPRLLPLTEASGGFQRLPPLTRCQQIHHCKGPAAAPSSPSGPPPPSLAPRPPPPSLAPRPPPSSRSCGAPSDSRHSVQKSSPGGVSSCLRDARACPPPRDARACPPPRDARAHCEERGGGRIIISYIGLVEACEQCVNTMTDPGHGAPVTSMWSGGGVEREDASRRLLTHSDVPPLSSRKSKGVGLR